MNRYITLVFFLSTLFSCENSIKKEAIHEPKKFPKLDSVFENGNYIATKQIDSNYIILFKIKEKYGIINELFDIHYELKLKAIYSDSSTIQLIEYNNSGGRSLYNCELNGNKITVGYYQTYYYPTRQFKTDFCVYAFKKEKDKTHLFFKGNFKDNSPLIENSKIEKSILLPSKYWDLKITQMIMFPKEIEIEFENNQKVKLQHKL